MALFLVKLLLNYSRHSLDLMLNFTHQPTKSRKAVLFRSRTKYGILPPKSLTGSLLAIKRLKTPNIGSTFSNSTWPRIMLGACELVESSLWFP